MRQEEDSFVADRYFHVYNRGAGKSIIFNDNNDRKRFLQALYIFNNKNNARNTFWQLEVREEKVGFRSINIFLKENNIKKDPLVGVLAYCLKGNHFHLLLKEVKKDGISIFMHRLGSGYARYFNGKNKRRGAFFEGRYKCKKIDNDGYLCCLLAYINIINPLQEVFLNIKEEGFKNIKKARRFVDSYKWSSQKEYLCKRKEFLIEKDVFTDIFKDKNEYCSFVDDVLENKRDVWEAEKLFLE